MGTLQEAAATPLKLTNVTQMVDYENSYVSRRINGWTFTVNQGLGHNKYVVTTRAPYSHVTHTTDETFNYFQGLDDAVDYINLCLEMHG